MKVFTFRAAPQEYSARAAPLTSVSKPTGTLKISLSLPAMFVLLQPVLGVEVI